MLACRTAIVAGIQGRLLDVEVSAAGDAPGLHLAGLREEIRPEARDRVRAAIINSGLPQPQGNLTVSLRPTALAIYGSEVDAAIAVAALAATGVVPARGDLVVLGELSLDGRLRPVPGVLPAVQAAAAKGHRTVVVPRANAAEASLIEGVTVLAVGSLAELVARLRGDTDDTRRPTPPQCPLTPVPPCQNKPGSG